MSSTSLAVGGDVAIVIPSCDKYADLWASFRKSIQKQWPDCPYPLYLVTNTLNCDDFEVIQVGPDMSWSANLLVALRRVNCRYVLLMIEDLFLRDRVNNAVVQMLIERCVSENWAYLRLNPLPPPPKRLWKSDGKVGRIPVGDWYRSAVVASLWRKDVLMDVLRPEENAWEFEIRGSERTDRYEDWFSTVDWHMPVHNLVIKGKLNPLVAWRLRRNGFEVPERRESMSMMAIFVFLAKKMRTMGMSLVPRRARRKVRSFFAPN